MSSVDLIFTSNTTPLGFPQGVSSASTIRFLHNYIFVYSPSKPLVVYDLKNNLRLDVEITGDDLVFIQPHNVKDDVILLATLNTAGKITVYLVYSNEKNILLPVIYAFYDEHLAVQKIYFHPTNKTVFLAVSGNELYSAKISSFIPAKESFATLVSSDVVYTTAGESFKDLWTLLYVVPPNTITSGYSTMSSTSMQKKKRTALPQTSIVTVAFHPDHNHVIVLLINNTLHCINLESHQHLLFTFFMPSYSVCPFPGIKSPTSSTSPFIPIYISVFIHPAFPNSAVILLFDVHFDVIGYKLDNYILRESEEASLRTKKKRERMSVTLKSTKTSKTPMRSSRSGKSPSRYTTPNKSPRSKHSPSRYFTPVKSQSKLSLSSSQRTSRSPPRNRRRGEDSESEEDREDEDDKNVVVLLDMLDDYEHLSITAVPKAAPIVDTTSHRRGSRALLNLRSGMNTNSASFLLPVTDPNFAASVAGRSGWGPMGSASTPLPNYSRSPAASSSLAQSPSFTLSMPVTPSTLGGRSSTPSCSPSPEGSDDLVPIKAPIRANVSHDLVVDLSFDPLARLWVVTHAVQQIVPDADEEIDENTPFSELKKPTRIISLFHIPLSASTAQRTTKKATFIPILIHNFVLLDRPNLAFSCRSHFLGAASQAQAHAVSGSPLAISSSSASPSAYSPSASSLAITRVPAYIFAYFATPPPPKADDDDADYAAPLFPFAPYPFRALSSQPGPIHPDELNPNKDDDDDDYAYADNLILGVFGSPTPARTSTPVPAQTAGALQAAALAMQPVIDTALQESGHQLATVFNALELQELASVAAVIATPSQRAAVARADRIYDLITWRRMKQAEKEHGKDIGAAAAAAAERQSRRISRAIESESDGAASHRKTETFLKKASLSVYGLLEKGVYTRTTTLVLIHYSDEESEKAFRKQEKEEKAKNKDKIVDEEPDVSEPDLIVLADAEAAVEEQARQAEWDRERNKVRVKKEEEKKNEEPPRKPSYADLGEAVKTLHEELVNEHELHMEADAERSSLQETVRANTAALQEAESRITELETNIDELENILVGTNSEEDEDGEGKRKEEKKGEKEKEKGGEIGQNLAKWEEQLREARADADRERKRAQELEVKRVRLEDAVAEKDRKIENLTTALKEGEEGGEDSDDGSANGSDKEIIEKLRARIAKLKTSVKHKNGEIVELRSTVDSTLKKVSQKLEKEGE